MSLSYKITLEDKRFWIFNDNDEITVYKDKKPYTLKVKDITNEYQIKDKYNNFYTFDITEFNDDTYPTHMLLKYSQDIQDGDLVVGPDNKMRTVENSHSGKDVMYKIKFNDGTEHIVNSSHLLPLYDENGNECYMSVIDYVHSNKKYKLRKE